MYIYVNELKNRLYFYLNWKIRMTWISTFVQDCSKTNLEMFQIEKKSEIAAADNDVGIGIGGTVVIGAFFSTF